MNLSSSPSVLIATSPYYQEITDELYAGARAVFDAEKVQTQRIDSTGAFELPAMIAMAARTQNFDGYLALGCVIRGETSHYEHICQAVSQGLMDLSLTGLPIGFGVLTCNTHDQAMQRALRSGGNKGAQAAQACLGMIRIARQYRDPMTPKSGA